MIPTNTKHALELWDAGEAITTIKMGGFGEGYERAIQTGVMEMIRKLINTPLPEDSEELNTLFHDTLQKVNSEVDLELSGAQAGAIINLTYYYLTRPWARVLADVPVDRHIQMSKNPPQER